MFVIFSLEIAYRIFKTDLPSFREKRKKIIALTQFLENLFHRENALRFISPMLQ